MHGDMYETPRTKSQARSLKTVAAAGSNMSSPPVREQLFNLNLFFQPLTGRSLLSLMSLHAMHA
jgi:hypothetical protein